MYVGIDVHKDTHTAVGLSPYGEKMFEITVGNYKNDFEILKEKVEDYLIFIRKLMTLRKI